MLFHRELAGINTFEVVGAKDTVEKEVMCECLHRHMFSHKVFFFFLIIIVFIRVTS